MQTEPDLVIPCLAINDVIRVAGPVDQIAKAFRRRHRQAARKGVRLLVLGSLGSLP